MFLGLTGGEGRRKENQHVLHTCTPPQHSPKLQSNDNNNNKKKKKKKNPFFLRQYRRHSIPRNLFLSIYAVCTCKHSRYTHCSSDSCLLDLHPQQQKMIFFLHMLKTGGSSLDSLLTLYSFRRNVTIYQSFCHQKIPQTYWQHFFETPWLEYCLISGIICTLTLSKIKGYGKVVEQ